MDIIYNQNRGIITYISKEGIQEIELSPSPIRDIARTQQQDRQQDRQDSATRIEDCFFDKKNESVFERMGVLIT